MNPAHLKLLHEHLHDPVSMATGYTVVLLLYWIRPGVYTRQRCVHSAVRPALHVKGSLTISFHSNMVRSAGQLRAKTKSSTYLHNTDMSPEPHDTWLTSSTLEELTCEAVGPEHIHAPLSIRSLATIHNMSH